jgi:hypothetical protein
MSTPSDQPLVISTTACADIPENPARQNGIRRVIQLSGTPTQDAQMPHAAFSGQTLDEIAANLPTALAAARDLARAARLAANRGLSCDRCIGEQVTPAESEIPP